MKALHIVDTYIGKLGKKGKNCKIWVLSDLREMKTSKLIRYLDISEATLTNRINLYGLKSPKVLDVDSDVHGVRRQSGPSRSTPDKFDRRKHCIRERGMNCKHYMKCQEERLEQPGWQPPSDNCWESPGETKGRLTALCGTNVYL